MARILDVVARKCISAGVELAPHLPLMHLETESSDVCLRTLREVARDPEFDEGEAAELLRTDGDWREQLVVAMLLLFRPLTDVLSNGLADRLRLPSIRSPQFTCIASAVGALKADEVTRHLSEMLAPSDANGRGLASRALGAVDVCSGEYGTRAVSIAGLDLPAYQAGATAFIEWRARLNAALQRIS